MYCSLNDQVKSSILLGQCRRRPVCRMFTLHSRHLALQHGVVPTTMKSAYIMPILKKTDMDPAETKSYQPISNCPCCPSCWRRSSLSSLWPISRTIVFFQIGSQLTGLITLRRRPCSTCWLAVGSGYWQSGGFDVTGLVGRFRQCRPWDTTQTAADVIRPLWGGH